LLQGPVPYEQMPACIAGCDIGMLAYPDVEFWRTSNPLKLLEYMAMNKPVIARDIEAFRAIIGGSGCAMFLSDNSPAAIAEALAEAYQRRRELPALGAGGRAQVLAYYTWEAQAISLMQFLHAIGGKNGNGKQREAGGRRMPA